MKRLLIIMTLSIMAAAALGYWARREFAVGGELFIPLAALAYTLFTEIQNDEESES